MIPLLIILGSFFVVFEMGKPRAREIALLATMTALCVAANEICAHTVPLHAGSMMVVVSGIAFGPEAGFLVGALSRLVSNFFDGQGPWTPWQMVSWGLIGFLAGLAFNKVNYRSLTKKMETKSEESLAQRLALKKSRTFEIIAGPVLCILAAWVMAYVVYVITGSKDNFFGWRLYAYGVAGLITGFLLQRKRLPVDAVTTTVFTFITIFLIYGGIMNFAAMVMEYAADSTHNAMNASTLRALYVTGAPYDAAHGAGAALCMLLFGDWLLQKLQRVQIKFGIKFRK